MTYQEVKAKYIKTLKESFAYGPEKAGFKIYVEKLTAIEDEYPEFVAKIDDELAGMDLDEGAGYSMTL